MRFAVGSKIGRTDEFGAQHVYAETGFLKGAAGPVVYVLRNDRGLETRLAKSVAEEDFDFFAPNVPDEPGTDASGRTAAQRLVTIVAHGERPWLEFAQRVRDEHEKLLALARHSLLRIRKIHRTPFVSRPIRSAPPSRPRRRRTDLQGPPRLDTYDTIPTMIQ
jgi:hypothetical protein